MQKAQGRSRSTNPAWQNKRVLNKFLKIHKKSRSCYIIQRGQGLAKCSCKKQGGESCAEWEEATAMRQDQPVRGWKPRLMTGGKGFFNTRSLAGMQEELPRKREGHYERRLSTPAAGAVAEEEGTAIVIKDRHRMKSLISQHIPNGTVQTPALPLPTRGKELAPVGGQCPVTHPGVLTNTASHPQSLCFDPFQETRFRNSRHSVAAKLPRSTSSHVRCWCWATT